MVTNPRPTPRPATTKSLPLPRDSSPSPIYHQPSHHHPSPRPSPCRPHQLPFLPQLPQLLFPPLPPPSASPFHLHPLLRRLLLRRQTSMPLAAKPTPAVQHLRCLPLTAQTTKLLLFCGQTLFFSFKKTRNKKKNTPKRRTFRDRPKKTEDVAHLLMYGPTRGSSSRPSLAPLLTAFQFAAVSGQEAEEAVVSRSTGHVFEKRLIEKYLAANDRRCPVTGQTLDADDLLPLKGTAPTVNLPRNTQSTNSSGSDF